ncbi:hypothetical protein [Hamadaea tsunoensis]|uniref:hypothetical protein n=1 Tax=Hamadaea tsunoensis TaxID=53368 RepID=UPI0004159C22|nr:hypothetical protein [Hamadaea tsunoensis]
MVNDDLLRRLRTEQARALLDHAEPHYAVMLACDLLVAGVDGEAVTALASESARSLPAHSANRRLAAVVSELGLPELAMRLEDVLGGQADDGLRSELAALARTILNRLTAGQERYSFNDLRWSRRWCRDRPATRPEWTQRPVGS